MKRHIFSLSIITFLTSIVWYRILFQTFTGEGFYYFFRGLEGDSNIFRYDIGAGLLFDILTPVFKDNFFPYQFLILFTLIILGILFYFIVYELTHKKSAALIASILFGINYNTAFEMIAIGAYQDFVQRVFFLLLLFPSFILFIKFIKNKKITYYVASLILGSLSVGLAYFNFFYIPFLIMYSLGIILTKKNEIKEKVYLSCYTIMYALTCFLIINIPKILKIPNYIPPENFFIFLINNTGEIMNNSLRQLTILSVPDIIFRYLFPIFNISYTEAIYYNKGIQYLYLPIFLIYITAGTFLYKKTREERLIIISSLLTLLFIFVLNIYMRNDQISILEPGGRYLFAPGLAYSVFWGVWLSYIYRKSSKTKIAVCIIIICWVTIQALAIRNQLGSISYIHTGTRKIVFYFKNVLSPKLRENSIVITPLNNWGSWYLNMFYGRKNTIFVSRMTPKFEWKAKFPQPSYVSDVFKRPFDPKKDFIIYYDVINEKVVDVTNDYKVIIE